MRRLVVVLALAPALIAAPASAELRQRDGSVCHDLIVIGSIKSYGEFASYYELDPAPDDNAIYIGGRYELTVAVDEVIEGQGPPSTIQVRALMASAHRLPVQMLFYLQKEERGSYWAADWQIVKPGAGVRIETPDDPPKRCEG